MKLKNTKPMRLSNKPNFNKFLILSFILPAIIYTIILIILSIYPFGNQTILHTDSYHQYYQFLMFFKESIMSGNISELLYSFNRGLGDGGLLFINYYISSPFNLILLLFSEKYFILGITFLIILKSCLSSLTCYAMLRYLYKIENIFTVIFSVIYPFSAFIFIYNINLMWLDAVILLPLLIISINKLIESQKVSLYMTLLFLLFVCNFYMGYIVGIFITIYFILNLIIKSKLKKSDKYKILLRFLGASCVAVLMYSILCIPTLIELKDIGAIEVINETNNSFFTNNSIISVILKLFLLNYDGVVFTNNNTTPYIYSTIFVITMIIYGFIVNKKDKDRLINSIIIICLLLAVFINPINLFYHAFDEPTGYQQRFSYIISLLMIMIGYKGFIDYSEKVNNKLIIKINFFLLLSFNILYLVESLYISNNFKEIVLIINTIIIIIYMLNFKLQKSNRLNLKNSKCYTGILISIILTELIINSIYLSYSINQRYINELDNGYINQTKNIIKELNRQDDDFFRISIPDNINSVTKISRNDSYNFNYKGLSEFSSTTNRSISQLLKKLGASADNGTFSCDPGYILDTLLGSKYIISSSGIDYSIYDEIYSNNKITVYKNPYYLGIGYIVSSDIKKLSYSDLNGNNIENQDKLLNNLSTKNKNEEYYRINNVSIIESNNIKIDKTNDGYILNTINHNLDSDISFSYSSDYDNTFITTNKDYKKDNKNAVMRLFVNSKEIDFGSNTLIHIGKGDGIVKLKLYGKLDNYNIGKMETYSINEENLIKLLTELNNNSKLKDIKFEKLVFTANIDMNEEKKLLFTSIPYDKGWKLFINDKETKIIPILDTFIGLELQEGYNKIELKYSINGLKIGYTLSVIGILIYSAIIIIERRKNKFLVK